MSVISVTRQYNDNGEYSLNEHNRNNPVSRSTVWTFLVTFDTPSVEPDDAITASGIPTVGDTHPTRANTRCKSVFAAREKNA